MSLTARIVGRVLAALVALILLGAALAALAEIVVGFFGGKGLLIPKEQWITTLSHTEWASPRVRIVATAVIVSGLIMLIGGLSARSRILQLRSPKDHITVTASARALAQALRRLAESVPGVSEASAELTARTARVVATVPLADPARVERELANTLGHALASMPWPTAPSLQIEVNSPRGASVADVLAPTKTEAKT